MSGPSSERPPVDERRNVEINVGKVCNSKCAFCLDGTPREDQKVFMPFDEMKAELERWRGEGFLSVGFLGGEPTVYPQIVDAVAYASALGYTRITLATNAMMMRRERFVAELVAAGMTRVTISMHGHTAALEDRLTRVPGAFEKKCAAIHNLRRFRDQGELPDGLSINAVLNRFNAPHLPRLMKFFFVTMGLDDLRVNFIRPEGNAEGSRELTPTYTEVRPMLSKAILLNEAHFKKTFTFGGVPLCVLPGEVLRSEALLRSYVGDVYRDLDTDCSIKAESYRDGVSQVQGDRARFNWRERKRFDLKHQLERCRECAAAELCEGVWRYYLDLYGPDEFSSLRREGEIFLRRRPLLVRPPGGGPVPSS